MPILLSQSKHEEFESNSVLQIINHKERRVEEARKMKPTKKLRRVRNFHTLRKLLLAIFGFCSVDPCLTSLFVIFPIFSFMYYGY